MSNLNELRDRVHDLAVEKGWYEGRETLDATTIGSMLALVHSEVSEALEELRDGRLPGDVHYKHGSLKPEGFGIELADAVIRILDLCGALEIDIERCVQLKHAFNETRPPRHGGKRL